MLTPYYATLMTSQVDGTAVTNTTTATTLIPAAAKYTFPANFLQFIGQNIRIRSAGRLSTAAATPGTITFDVRTPSAVLLFNGGASQTLQTSKTNVTWTFDVTMTLRTVGSAANFMGIGEFKSEAISATASVAATMMLPTSAPAVGSNVDATATITIDHFVTFSVASASNSITCHMYQLDAQL